MKKPIPTFKTDEEAENFVATADLTEYDLSGGRLMRFELRPKDKSVSLRLPEKLLTAVRSRAKRVGVPYQRFIRMALEQAVQEPIRKGRSGLGRAGFRLEKSPPASRQRSDAESADDEPLDDEHAEPMDGIDRGERELAARIGIVDRDRRHDEAEPEEKRRDGTV
jgi:predicted DNA binding CopG/RHH family protein